MADPPSGLGRRGRALWDDLHGKRAFNPAELVTLAELCRMADRLDKLDGLLRGEIEHWAVIVTRHNGRSHTVEVVLDDALAESRQIAATFARLAGSLNIPEAKVATRDGIDEIAKRRADRTA